MSGPVLIVGGAADPNLRGLLARAEVLGVPAIGLLIHPDETPRITWDLDADTLVLDGAPIAPRGVFLRADVFWHDLDPRPEVGYRAHAWHAALHGWARAHRGVRLLNRDARSVVKPEALLLARRAGLRVPETIITNDLGILEARGRAGAVAKPIAGGGHCRPLAELLGQTVSRAGATAAPATVQARMPGRDVRVYAVGPARVAFALRSEALDYRLDPDVRIERLEGVPPEVAAPLDRLLAELGLDLAAADLKEDEEGRLRFLEVNNQPMFAAFDRASDGEISAAILRWLQRRD